MNDDRSSGARSRAARLGGTALVLALGAMGLAGCSGAGGIGVAGDEYAFSGMPATLVPGDHAFKFRNIGHEAHEMVVIRLKPGAGDLRQVLSLPREEAESKVEIIGMSSAAPGEQGTKVSAQLQAGTYALVCFLPVGTDGPPHYTRGMLQTFTVA